MDFYLISLYETIICFSFMPDNIFIRTGARRPIRFFSRDGSEENELFHGDDFYNYKQGHH